MLIAAGKQPEVTNDTSPVSTAVTTETSISQRSATLPMGQPQYGMLLNYFSSQTVTPTNALLVQQTYSDPNTSIHGSDNFSQTNELAYGVPSYNQPPIPPEVPWCLSVLSQMRCLTDMYKGGKTGRDQSDRLIQSIRAVHLIRSDRSRQPV